MCRVVILMLSVLCFSKGSDAHGTNDAMVTVIKSLFNKTSGYDRLLSPTNSENTPLPVNLSLIINNVHDLDEATGTLTLNGWLSLMWTDRRLIWDTLGKGLTNRSVVHLPTYYFWAPDIALENHVDSFSTLASSAAQRTLIALHSNGKLVWTFSVTLQTSCPIDHRNYPFDEHVCHLRLIGQTHNYSKIILHKTVLHNHHGSHGEYAEPKTNANPIWTIVKQKSEIVHNQKRKQPDNHSVFQYTVHLRRHSPGQKCIILMPIIVAMGMTLSVFWLPPASGQRITLGGIAVLVLLAMLLYIGWKIPSGGRHIPTVVVLNGASLLMAGMSLIISVIVSRLTTFSIYRPMPGVLKSFLGRPRIRQFFCINFPNSQMGDDGIQLIRNSADATTEAQPQNSTSDNYPSWKAMAHVTDRISFIFFVFTFVILLSSFTM